jgi:hypothetical protein
MSLPKLNFPPCALRVTRRGADDYVWDPLRGQWLRCTPEEWVRRHTIGWLTGSQGVTAQYIVQEYPVDICGMAQRADIVVMDADMRPRILVECKAPGVALDEAVLRQAVRYNSVVGARYIMLTNGLTHFFWKMDEKTGYTKVPSLSAN